MKDIKILSKISNGYSAIITIDNNTIKVGF